jgi:hypothetical protein
MPGIRRVGFNRPPLAPRRIGSNAQVRFQNSGPNPGNPARSRMICLRVPRTAHATYIVAAYIGGAAR